MLVSVISVARSGEARYMPFLDMAKRDPPDVTDRGSCRFRLVGWAILHGLVTLALRSGRIPRSMNAKDRRFER